MLFLGVDVQRFGNGRRPLIRLFDFEFRPEVRSLPFTERRSPLEAVRPVHVADFTIVCEMSRSRLVVGDELRPLTALCDGEPVGRALDIGCPAIILRKSGERVEERFWIGLYLDGRRRVLDS